METLNKNYAVQATTWVREENYIKIPNPLTNRQVFLTGEKADVFELLDESLTPAEIFEELKDKYSITAQKSIDDVIALLCELNLVQVVDQFDN